MSDLFANHFYHSITRKSISAFGSIFNDIHIMRYNRSSGDDEIIDRSLVPIGYAPRHKYIARLDEQDSLEDTKIALKLPRMSFEITDISYDSDAKLNAHQQILMARARDDVRYTLQYVPYILNFDLSIYVKHQDDGFQIMEQILPRFQPHHTLSIRFLDDMDHGFDFPVTLESVSMDDDYESDMQSRRNIIFTLSFSTKVRYFGQPGRSGIITRTDIYLSAGDRIDRRDATGRISSIAAPVVRRETARASRTGDRVLTLTDLSDLSPGDSYLNNPITRTAAVLSTADGNVEANSGVGNTVIRISGLSPPQTGNASLIGGSVSLSGSGHVIRDAAGGGDARVLSVSGPTPAVPGGTLLAIDTSQSDEPSMTVVLESGIGGNIRKGDIIDIVKRDDEWAARSEAIRSSKDIFDYPAGQLELTLRQPVPDYIARNSRRPGETIVGLHSQSSGELIEVGGDTLTLTDVDGNFSAGETVIGIRSRHSSEMLSARVI